MFGATAYAQTAASTAPASAGGIQDLLAGPLPMILMMVVLGYFLLWRPQQKRIKDHQELVKAIKRGDVVVLSSGVIGKVTKVEDTELGVEIATGVVVKVVRSTVSEVRTRAEPANDSK